MACAHTTWRGSVPPNPPLVLVLLYSIQCSGLGGMKPNCVLIAWPDSWRKKDSASTFMSEERGEGRGERRGRGRGRGRGGRREEGREERGWEGRGGGGGGGRGRDRSVGFAAWQCSAEY